MLNIIPRFFYFYFYFFFVEGGNKFIQKKDIYLFNSILQHKITSSSILYCCTKGYSIRNKFHSVSPSMRNYYCTNKDRWEIPQYALRAR